MDEQAWVREEVRAALGARAGAAHVLQRREGALVLRVQVGAQAVVLRLTAPEAARGDDERTASVVALARAAGVPAPAVLTTGAALRAPWRVSVEEHVEGTPWAEVHGGLGPAEARAVHADLGAALLALQSVRPGGFGELDRSGRPAGVPLLTALRDRVDLRVPAGPARVTAHRLLDQEAASFAGHEDAVLVHDDLHAANVLVRRTAGGWRLAALLDWEKAWAGPADADLARTSFWDGMSGPASWSTGVRRGDPRRALVHQLLWCLEHDWATPRHRADTARLRARLGV